VEPEPESEKKALRGATSAPLALESTNFLRERWLPSRTHRFWIV